MKLGTQINYQQHHLIVLLYCTAYVIVAMVMVVITLFLFSTYSYSYTYSYMDLEAKMLMAAMYYYTNSAYAVIMNSYYLSLLAVKSRLVMLNDSIRFVQVKNNL